MHRKASIRLMIAVMGAVPLATRAAGPATQPVELSRPSLLAAPAAPAPDPAPVDNTKPDHTPGGDDVQGGHGRSGQRGLITLSKQEQAEAMDFMQTNSPKRYAAMESLPDSPRTVRIKNAAALAALQLMKSQRDDPKLYQVSLKRMKLEDDVFDLVAQLHKAPADKQDAIKTELKSKVGELVDSGIEERQLRLEKLQQTVEKEKQKLTEDQANKDKLVEDRFTAILNDERGLGASFNAGGPGGNGGPGRHHGQHQPGEGTPPQ